MKKLLILSITLLLATLSTAKAVEPTKVAAFTIPYFSAADAAAGLDTVKVTAAAMEHKIDSLTQKVKEENLLVGLLDASKSYTLPIGIQKNVGAGVVTIVLDELRLLPNRAVVKAYLKLDIPEAGRSIFFCADEVTVGPDGIEAAKLQLFRDEKLTLLGKDIILKKGDTFVEWDCNGYKTTSLSGEMLIKNENLIPKGAAGQSNVKNGELRAAVTATFTDVNDILFKVSLGAFEIKGLKDFVFRPEEVYVDMSDTQNPAAAKFPSGYTTSTMASPGEFTWRGVYIKKLSLELPKTFTKNAKPATLSMVDMLIDECGFTGSVEGTEIIPKQGGDLGGWPFSISKLSLALYKNRVDACRFEGAIKAGFINTANDISYKASFDNGNFFLSATLPSDVKFDALGAKVNLSHNSAIIVEYKDGEYLPRLNLHGYMDMDVAGLKLGKMDFQDLEISTVSPYVKFSYISVTTGSTAGFPISLRQLAFTSKDSLLKMKALIDVNLMGEGDNGFSGTGGFTITAVNKGGKALSYKYKGFQLDTLGINIKEEAFSIEGYLVTYNEDKVYGNGFKGGVKASFMPGVAGGATAQFGSVDGYRYWYADAYIRFPSPIIIPPVLGITGFGGGAYQHMKVSIPEKMVVATGQDSVKKASVSMATYVPDKNISLGIKASILLVFAPNQTVFNGNIQFEATFNKHGGLAYCGFLGDINVFKDPGVPAEEGEGISARIKLDYFVEEKTFQGRVDLFINLYGIMNGAHEKNRAGTILMYFAPKDWYLYMGTPSDRMAVKFLGLATLDNYFMVGTNIPDIPPLPKEVTSILGDIDRSSSRSTAALTTGKGMAMGASLKIDTGEQTFLAFYGSFGMGMGFDMLIRDFGDARCKGSGNPVGINGWYAKGQLYSWVKGDIGVKVKIFRKKKKVSILEIGAAAVFIGELPNPVYMKGVVGGKYRALGGLVKGNCRFEVKVGSKCEMVTGSALDNIDVISEITPGDGTDKVDVFTLPQVAFNIPVDKEFKLMDVDDIVKTFKAKLCYFRVVDGASVLKCREKWNEQNDVLALEPFEILPGSKQLRMEAKIQFEVLKGGKWEIYKDSGEDESETKAVTITTGVAPDYIPASNVVYTYPAEGMLNYYKNEHSQGYIALKQGMKYLFEPKPGWKQQVRYASGSGSQTSTFSYSEGDKTLSFTVPSIANSSVYALEVVNVPTDLREVKADSNLVKVAKTQESGDTLTTNDLEGNIKNATEKKLFALNFRTSMYNTFAEKLQQMSKPSRSREWIYSTVHNFIFSYPMVEPFDKYEQEHVLVDLDLPPTTWYKDIMDEVMYRSYPVKPELTVDWRKVVEQGAKAAPSGAITFKTDPESLSESAVKTGLFTYGGTTTDFYFQVGVYAYRDHVDLVNKAAYYLYKYPDNALVQKLYRSIYYSIYEFSDYSMTLRYKLPGTDKVTSSGQIKFDL